MDKPTLLRGGQPAGLWWLLNQRKATQASFWRGLRPRLTMKYALATLLRYKAWNHLAVRHSYQIHGELCECLEKGAGSQIKAPALRVQVEPKSRALGTRNDMGRIRSTCITGNLQGCLRLVKIRITGDFDGFGSVTMHSFCRRTCDW